MVLSREARIVAGVTLSAPIAAAAISGGFFGLAFIPAFRWLIYLGAASLTVAVI